MRRCLAHIAAIVALLSVSPALSAGTPTARADSAVTGSTDTRPLLKRLFKDFPVVYSDTAYTAPDYIFVFKCTLMNHSWHYHHGSKIRPADSAATKDDGKFRPMVIFSTGRQQR